METIDHHGKDDFKKNRVLFNRNAGILIGAYLIGALVAAGIASIVIGFIPHLFTSVTFPFWLAVFSVIPAFFSILIFKIVFKNSVLKPLQSINKMIRELKRENFNARIQHSRRDEMGETGHYFNQLAEHLELIFIRLTKKMRMDPLTGLPNRQQILIDITQAELPTLVLMNIDYFKELNDCYGNRTGDIILKEIAERLSSFQEKHSFTLYKMPADEYALLFNIDLEKKDLETVIQLVSSYINDKPYRIDDNLIQVHVTCGAAMAKDLQDQPDGKTWRNLATNADMALKKAKKSLQSLIIFTEDLNIRSEYRNNLFWKQSVREAITDRRIVPYFQPIINNRTGKIEKYETLVRLIDNDGNIVTPHYFLEIAKKTHIYGDITRAVVEQAFEMFKERPFEFSINLTVHDILDHEIQKYILNKIRKNLLVSKRLVFEILESEGIENYRDVMIFIEEAKECGCKIAIDDFGSGYSNFDHILRLAVDYIKIDASLIRNIDIDKNAQIITKTIVGFSKELGLQTISEFVHTREVFEMTQSLGVDYSQGYYFGEPQNHLSVQSGFKGFEAGL